MEAKEREFTLTLQEMKLQIKEMEFNSMQHKKAPSFDIDPPDRLRSLSRAVKNLIISYLMEHDRKFLKWRELGSRLGFSEESMDKIETSERSKFGVEHTQETPEYTGNLDLQLEYNIHNVRRNCINEIIKQWLDSYPGDSQGSNSFATYTWLKRALIEAGLGACARDLPPYEEMIGKQ